MRLFCQESASAKPDRMKLSPELNTIAIMPVPKVTIRAECRSQPLVSSTPRPHDQRTNDDMIEGYGGSKAGAVRVQHIIVLVILVKE